MTRVEAKSETRKSFQKHCQGAVDEHIVDDDDVAMAIVPTSVLEQEPYAAPVARHILRRQRVLLRSMLEAQPAGGRAMSLLPVAVVPRALRLLRPPWRSATRHG